MHLTLTLTLQESVSVPPLQLRKLRLAGRCFFTLMRKGGSTGGPGSSGDWIQRVWAGTPLTSSQVAPLVQGPSFEEQRGRGSVTVTATQHLAESRGSDLGGPTPQRLSATTPGASVFQGRLRSDARRFPHLSVLPSGLPASVATCHRLAVLLSYLTKCFCERL